MKLRFHNTSTGSLHIWISLKIPFQLSDSQTGSSPHLSWCGESPSEGFIGQGRTLLLHFFESMLNSPQPLQLRSLKEIAHSEEMREVIRSQDGRLTETAIAYDGARRLRVPGVRIPDKHRAIPAEMSGRPMKG